MNPERNESSKKQMKMHSNESPEEMNPQKSKWKMHHFVCVRAPPWGKVFLKCLFRYLAKDSTLNSMVDHSSRWSTLFMVISTSEGSRIKSHVVWIPVNYLSCGLICSILDKPFILRTIWCMVIKNAWFSIHNHWVRRSRLAMWIIHLNGPNQEILSHLIRYLLKESH